MLQTYPMDFWGRGILYDPVTNPNGLITSLSVAENSLLSDELVAVGEPSP